MQITQKGPSMNSRLAALIVTLPLAHHSVMAQHLHNHGVGNVPSASDTRVMVQFPDAIRAHTLISMREHLAIIGQLQSALAAEKYDEAAKVAEFKLGMSSLAEHGAHESAKFMPKGMQDAGMLMHRSASQFAIESQNAAATGDGKKALAALSKITQACVACHAGFRLQ
jgi:cytochrome c556